MTYARLHQRAIGGAAAVALLFASACASRPAEQPHISAQNSVQAGEYAIRLAGCNDCHTPGWSKSGGSLPTSKWLTGSKVGFRGPWGTAYPINVRLFAQSIPKSAWVSLFKSGPTLPVMPFFDYSHGQIASSDLGAMYDFIVSLGKAGETTPNDLPPGKTPTTKYIYYVPHTADTDGVRGATSIP